MMTMARRIAGLVHACVYLSLSTLSASVLFAQQSGVSNLPLERLLKSDGTLSVPPGYAGSADPTGWGMKVAPNGHPRFFRTSRPRSGANTSSDTADSHWDSRFVGPSGVDGAVNALAVIGPDIYVAGSFTGTATTLASFIVRWNSSADTWSALGDGVDDVVNTLAVVGTDLYVGGAFSHAGGVPARHIARWNGASWSALGTSPNDGVNAVVTALVGSGTALFVGGGFTTAGNGTTVNRIASWDGSSWSALGTGMDSYVYALAVSGSDLFAGGDFTAAGGVPARHVARWTGSAWVPLGTSPNDGVSDAVFALAAASPFLYVGGNFVSAGANISANHVARWNGIVWSALGNGFDGSVTTLCVDGPLVYAGGHFTATGINPAKYIAVWDTSSSSWSGLNGGLNAAALALLRAGTALYAGGDFTTYANTSSASPANHAARWTAGAWQGLGASNNNSIDGSDIYAIAFSGSDAYIGGFFTTAGGILANNIAKYNLATNSWSALGSGVDDQVNTIAIGASGNVYAGGYFLHAGGNPAKNIARWNGSAWSTLGTPPDDGTDGPVFAMTINGPDIFVGGRFSAAGTIAASCVALWDGASWSPLGTGVNDEVDAVAIKSSELYAGGWFTKSGGTDINHVARWNGTSWLPLGTAPHDGVNRPVHAMAVTGTGIYVAGDFDTVAGETIPAGRIASWDGSSWAPLGNGFNGSVSALCVSGGSLYATGYFTNTGIFNVNNIARWDSSAGGSWNALGSGLSDGGESLAASGNDLLVGGSFSRAGGKPSFRLARWNPGLIAASVEYGGSAPAGFRLDQNYPNPFNPSTTIRYTIAAAGHVRLELFNVLGEKVETLANGVQAAGRHVTRWDASRLAAGMYFCRLSSGPFTQTIKLLFLR